MNILNQNKFIILLNLPFVKPKRHLLKLPLFSTEKNWNFIKINILTRLIIIILIFFTTLIASCKAKKDEEVSDINKMANYSCNVQKLMNIVQKDTSKIYQLTALEKEATQYKAFLDEKYKGQKDNISFKTKMNTIIDSVMKNCK